MKNRIRKGDTIKAYVDKIVFGGQALAYVDKKPIFLWNALPEEEVTVEIIRVKKNLIEGIASQVSKSSKDRIDPIESHYLSCSPWQIMTFQAEEKYKESIAKETFQYLSGLPLDKTHHQSADEQNYFSYRNKMEYSFAADSRNNVSLAFFNRGTHRKFPHTGCILAKPEINQTAALVVDWFNENKFPSRSLKSIIIRSNEAKETIVAIFIKDHISLLKKPDLPSFVKGIHMYYSNPKSPASRPDAVLYSKGCDYLQTHLLSRRFRYGLFSFFQVNQLMFENALRDIASFLDADTELLDYYSGVGAISIALNDSCKSAILIENNEEAVAYAHDNIKYNNLTNFSITCSTTEKIYNEISPNKTILFDPPRSGLHPKLVKKVLLHKPKKIIYLSCNLATLARDIKDFSQDYSISFFKTYNFFPRTPHFETLVVLEPNY